MIITFINKKMTIRRIISNPKIYHSFLNHLFQVGYKRTSALSFIITYLMKVSMKELIRSVSITFTADRGNWFEQISFLRHFRHTTYINSLRVHITFLTLLIPRWESTFKLRCLAIGLESNVVVIFLLFSTFKIIPVHFRSTFLLLLNYFTLYISKWLMYYLPAGIGLKQMNG